MQTQCRNDVRHEASKVTIVHCQARNKKGLRRHTEESIHVKYVDMKQNIKIKGVNIKERYFLLQYYSDVCTFTTFYHHHINNIGIFCDPDSNISLVKTV